MDLSISPYFIGPRSHIFLFATLFLIAGIITAYFALPPWTIIIVSMLSIAALFFEHFYTYTYNLSLLLLPLSFTAGMLLCNQQITIHFDFQKKFNNIPLNITGSVASLERVQSSRHHWHMIVDLEEIELENCKIKSQQSVAIYLVRHPKVTVGDKIQIADVVFKKIENKDFNLYLAKEKICATVFIDTSKITQLSSPDRSISRYLSHLRNRIFSTLQQQTSKETFTLFSSIFLGNKASVKQEMEFAKEPFKVWGISHYLARSGLHLLIFGIVWHFILGFLPILFFWKQLFLLLLIICYALLSWPSISFNRALIMFLVAKFCLLHKIPLHYVHLICLATCIILICNPLQLFYLDFQLSFGLTFALAWFNHIENHKKAA